VAGSVHGRRSIDRACVVVEITVMIFQHGTKFQETVRRIVTAWHDGIKCQLAARAEDPKVLLQILPKHVHVQSTKR
jgi:hypothetical protein